MRERFDGMPTLRHWFPWTAFHGSNRHTQHTSHMRTSWDNGALVGIAASWILEGPGSSSFEGPFRRENMRCYAHENLWTHSSNDRVRSGERSGSPRRSLWRLRCSRDG